MLYYDRIDVSEGIDVNKTSASNMAADMWQNSIVAYFNSIISLSLQNFYLYSKLILILFSLLVFIQ